MADICKVIYFFVMLNKNTEYQDRQTWDESVQHIFWVANHGNSPDNASSPEQSLGSIF